MSKASRVDNPLFPLPADYESLTREGQRKARVAAVCNQHTPQDLVAAWAFFRQHYLMSLPEGVWHKPPVYQSPECHYNFVYDLGAYARNVKIMPRSYAKSTLIEELLLTICYGRAPFKVLIIKSCEDFVKECFTRLQFQIDSNKRLLEDFGVLRPMRNTPGIWSKNRLWLTNGFQLIGRSVFGKLLGPRPQLLICDDAEIDTSMRVSPSALHENFRRMWFNNLMPQLDMGCAAALVGTLFNRKLFIYGMATEDEKEDPTLSYWNRETIAIIDPETGEPTWPAKFPPEKIAELRQSLPPEVFASQYMNDPGTGESLVFKLDPKLSYYTVDDPADLDAGSPLHAPTMFHAWVKKRNGDPEKVSRRFGETVSKMFRVLVADPIRRASSRSDFACVLVVGMERSKELRDTWWLLDIRYGRPKPVEFLDWVWVLGKKWQPRIVAVESIGVQKGLAEQAAEMYDIAGGSLKWTPRVLPLNYRQEFSGDLGKASRISSLAWRFEFNKIKLPKWCATKPGWRDLILQITNFTPDMALLPHDDAIDTLAMASFVGKRGAYFTENRKQDSLFDLLARGVEFIPGTQTRILEVVNGDELPPDALAGIDLIRSRRNNDMDSNKKTDRHGHLRHRPIRKRYAGKKLRHGSYRRYGTTNY